MTHDLSCFKAYDIRGRVPDALNPDLARALGRAVADVLGARSVVLGRDARLSGPELRDALAQGLLAAGARVTDLGLCGTEEIYYAAANQPFDAGIMITGSHNPADENGFKLVRAGAVPISGDSGLYELKERVARGLRRALFLSGEGTLMIVGHQAINRTLLSLFLFQRASDVPYTYIPQNQYYHITITQRRKLFEMIRYA